MKGYKCEPGCECGRHRPNVPGYQKTGKKRCTKCQATKPLSDFDVHHQGESDTVYHAACKGCRAEVTYIQMRRRNFMATYGITLEEYEALHEAQGGVCAICGNPEWVTQKGKLRRLSVDHDHVTGKVRGLLCCNCNRAIGFLRDDAELVKRALYYLESGGDYPE